MLSNVLPEPCSASVKSLPLIVKKNSSVPVPAVLVNVAEIFALISAVLLIALATSSTVVTELRSITVFTLELK